MRKKKRDGEKKITVHIFFSSIIKKRKEREGHFFSFFPFFFLARSLPVDKLAPKSRKTSAKAQVDAPAASRKKKAEEDNNDNRPAAAKKARGKKQAEEPLAPSVTGDPVLDLAMAERRPIELNAGWAYMEVRGEREERQEKEVSFFFFPFVFRRKKKKAMDDDGEGEKKERFFFFKAAVDLFLLHSFTFRPLGDRGVGATSRPRGHKAKKKKRERAVFFFSFACLFFFFPVKRAMVSTTTSDDDDETPTTLPKRAGHEKSLLFLSDALLSLVAPPHDTKTTRTARDSQAQAHPRERERGAVHDRALHEPLHVSFFFFFFFSFDGFEREKSEKRVNG